jgi:hypothetical protein
MVFTLRHESKLHIISHILPHFTTLLISYAAIEKTGVILLIIRFLKSVCSIEIKKNGGIEI